MKHEKLIAIGLILTLGLFLTIGCIGPFAEEDEEDLEVWTDQESYELGEEIEITIKNQGEETVMISTYTPAVPDVQRFKEGEWRDITIRTEPALAAIVDLLPEESYSYTWDQTEYIRETDDYEAIQAEPGQYRAEWLNQTAEFTIEQPAE